jgi:hypothetical protein
LAEQQKVLRPLQEEAAVLNRALTETNGPAFAQACADVPDLRELSGKRGKARIALRAVAKVAADTNAVEAARTAAASKLPGLTNQLAQLDTELATLTESKPDARKAAVEREKILGQLGANRAKQEVPDGIVKTRGKDVQFWQELGGLFGRITLAILLAVAISKGALLRLFQIPGLIVIPVTYFWLFRDYPELFQWGVAVAGFLTVAQFSYFGEYLPKVFPLHLRATGGSFATNVGGRMLGTSAAFVTTNIVAKLMLGGSSPGHVATAAAIVGTSMFLIGLVLSFLLQEPKQSAGSE